MNIIYKNDKIIMIIAVRFVKVLSKFFNENGEISGISKPEGEKMRKNSRKHEVNNQTLKKLLKVLLQMENFRYIIGGVVVSLGYHMQLNYFILTQLRMTLALTN